ncbi:MAG: hypothetical protein MJ157_03195 [Clostridia bacterium]|nr:hypothetical protein [Clostridia bacterium]
MIEQKAEQVFQQLKEALEQIQSCPEENRQTPYGAYLHGQIYGLATALKIIFPGEGNWGEKAGLAVRPVITEHKCED